MKKIIAHLNRYKKKQIAAIMKATTRFDSRGCRVDMTPAGRRAELKQAEKEHQRDTARIYAADTSRGIKLAKITVEWKKSRTWGNCPRVSVRVWSKSGEYYEGTGYASGCGYDKESAAINSALNGCAAWDFEVFNNKKKDIYPFHFSDSDALPLFDFGGCGVSCLRALVDARGLKWSEAHGRAFDYYEING